MCRWAGEQWEPGLGFGVAGISRSFPGVLLVRKDKVRGAGEGGEVEELRASCTRCCQAFACPLWALHCAAAALLEEVGPHLRTPAGRFLLGLVRRVAGPEGLVPRPQLLQLLMKLAEAAGSCGGMGNREEGGGGGVSSTPAGGAVGAGGGASLAAGVPDPRVWGGAWAIVLARQLLPPHAAGQQLGVRLCGNPRCEA